MSDLTVALFPELGPLASGFDAERLESLAPDSRWRLVRTALARFYVDWHAGLRPFLDWGLAEYEARPQAVPPDMPLMLAEGLLHGGERQRARAIIATLDPGPGAKPDPRRAAPLAAALRAYLLVQEGDWPGAQAGFTEALHALNSATHRRRGLLPISLAWLYPLSLLAQRSPPHVELARRFCEAEAGSRGITRDDDWAAWSHAIACRLGETRVDERVFWLGRHADTHALGDLWRCLLRAWLGPDAPTNDKRQDPVARARALAMRRHAARDSGLHWLAAQLDAAEAVAAGDEAPSGFFAGRQESWREALEALQGLAGEARALNGEVVRRYLWALSVDDDGQVGTIEPMEQTRGPRGWNRPRPVPLARLADSDALEPWDARVAHAIRTDRSYHRRHVIDRAEAIVALIGHPAVVLAQAPEQTVELVEGSPQLEVIRQGNRYMIRVMPALCETPDMDRFLPAASQAEAQVLRQITVLRDGPQRLRVIRLTPAQCRAAALIARGLAVPADAQHELDATLRALAGHFQIQSDHAGGREVEAEHRLRAELAPVGKGLTLRLVVTPLGPLGPRLAPGTGRARLMATVQRESVATERDLQAELAHVNELFAALPFLVPLAPDSGELAWTLSNPEEALTVVETLPRLSGVQSIEWPKGREVRMVAADIAQVAVRVVSENQWFRLVGELDVGQGLVMELEKLLAWSAAHAGRFVPMGQGVYLALTRSLRGKLRELALMTDHDSRGIRVPLMAAPWLEDVLAGAGVEPDAYFGERLRALRQARAARPAVPRNLQATLRPYQDDGFAWAMTLAEAGFGACLADDMGLGKTLQALAVLLARAQGGAALVIAPTSVCGNWVAEAQRFAPSLRVHLYAEGERTTLIEQAGAHDVVIVSYGLLQQARAAFRGRDWHTVVADEAQSFKNAAAQRSQAMFELRAGFRLALSGTPVENRLAELWSIMRFCNPGLLGSLARFNDRYATPIERNGHREPQRMLRRLIAPFVLRRTKSEVLEELPPRTELVLRVAPDAVEAAHYEALRRQAVREAETAESASARRGGPPPAQARLHVLAQLTRLRRAACDARLVTPELTSELPTEGAKLRAFVELAGELAGNGHKTLVFSQFVDFLQLLRGGLERAGIVCQYLDGATPAAERTRRVAAFQAGHGDVFLISLKAGGFGLNLTAADYVIIADPWWNPAAEDQAMGRAHRIGQQRPVTVYRLITAGTIEERIVELHHGKRALAEGVLDGAEDAHGAGALPSTEELLALLRGQ